MEKVRGLQNLAYQLGLEEGKKLQICTFLYIINEISHFLRGQDPFPLGDPQRS